MEPSRVLIVDDDPLVAETYGVAFESAGFVVHTAQSGAGGFAALQVFRPDVVILDLHMPGSGGLDWLIATRSMPDFASLPVVVATAAPESPEAAAAVEAGAHGVLNKQQWSPDALVAAATWAINQRSPDQDLFQAA
jgi:CheY-like chemotaxis protein